MAFSSAITRQTIMGNKRVTEGTWTSGSTTGGDIDTGLNVCEFITLQAKGSSVSADAPVVNETLPIAGSAITIVTTSSVDGYWRAEGY